jgi:hypothetical protein
MHWASQMGRIDSTIITAATTLMTGAWSAGRGR